MMSTHLLAPDRDQEILWLHKELRAMGLWASEEFEVLEWCVEG